MFMQPGAFTNGSPMMRPAFLATVLVFMFLTMHTDWSSRQPGQVQMHSAASPATAPTPQANKPVHEQIIFELSVINERLERESAALRQHVLDIRRAARAAGLKLNSTTTFLPIPGLEAMLTVPIVGAVPAAEVTVVAGGSAARTPADVAPMTDGETAGGKQQTSRGPRHRKQSRILGLRLQQIQRDGTQDSDPTFGSFDNGGVRQSLRQ